MGAIPPPPGIVPNLTNPSYISGSIFPISALFLSLSYVLLNFRLYTRLRIVPPFRIGMDDWVVVAAWLINVAYTATVLARQNKGNGRHLWDLPMETFMQYVKWVAISELLYVPATALPKIAILIAYLRVFTNRKFRIAVWTIIFTTIGHMIVICVVVFFHCQPMAKSWEFALPGRCILIAPYTWNAILNVSTDILVLLVPVPMLWRWKVPARRKIVTGCIFATGSLTCILSAIRTYYVSRMQHTIDLTRVVVIPTSLSVAETNLTVICGCLMVARPFLRKHFPSLLSSKSGPVEQISPPAIDDDQAIPIIAIPAKCRPRTSAGFGSINTSAGWAWNGRSGIESQTACGIPVADLESGGARGWPLRNDRSPGENSRDNIIEWR